MSLSRRSMFFFLIYLYPDIQKYHILHFYLNAYYVWYINIRWFIIFHDPTWPWESSLTWRQCCVRICEGREKYCFAKEIGRGVCVIYYWRENGRRKIFAFYGSWYFWDSSYFNAIVKHTGSISICPRSIYYIPQDFFYTKTLNTAGDRKISFAFVSKQSLLVTLVIFNSS